MATATEHRRDLLELVSIAEGDLRLLFREFTSADEARDALMDTLPVLIATYGAAAATLAADWYDEVREERGVPGRFRAIPAALVADRGRTDSLARWSVTPLYSDSPDYETTFEKVMGGTQRLITDAARETMLGSLRQDPRGAGWRRETGGGACNFCTRIAARSATYSAETADFASHDNCNCVAVSVFSGETKEVKAYTPSQRFRTPEQRAAHNARTRAWLAE